MFHFCTRWKHQGVFSGYKSETLVENGLIISIETYNLTSVDFRTILIIEQRYCFLKSF